MRRKRTASAASGCRVQILEQRLLLSGAATVTTLSINPSTTVFGQAFDIAVAVTAAGAPVTEGTVQVLDNGTVIASATLSTSNNGSLQGPVQATYNGAGQSVFWTEANVFSAQYTDGSGGAFAASQSQSLTETVTVPTFSQSPGTLRVTTVQTGSGAAATDGQSVTVAYTGYLTTGQIFDSSAIEAPTSQNGTGDLTFTLGGGQTIAGFDAGIVGMEVGETRVIDIPAAQAYGANPPAIGPSGVAIPPNSELVYVVTMDANNSLPSPPPPSSPPPPASSSPLVPTLTKTTLPAAVVAGGTSRGVAAVQVQNSGSTTESGRVNVAVYASTDGAIDGSSTQIGSISEKLLLKGGKSTVVPVPVKSIPASLSGSYTLLAQVTDASSLTSYSTTGPTLTAAAPFIRFSEQLIATTLGPSDVSGQKTTATLELKLTNNGNVASTGPTVLGLYASPDTSAADGTLIRNVNQVIALQPGTSRVVSVPLQALPPVANGNYYLVVQVTDPDSNLTSASSTGTYMLAASYSSLVPAHVSFTTTGGSITFSVTNDGNIAAPGLSTVRLYDSPDGTLNNATTITSQKVNLAGLRPTKVVTLRLPLTKAESAVFLKSPVVVLQLTDPLGNSQTA